MAFELATGVVITLLVIATTVGFGAQCLEGKRMSSLVQSIESCANAISNSQLSSTIQDDCEIGCLSNKELHHHLENIST